MKERFAELQRSLEQWQFTVPPSCAGEKLVSWWISLHYVSSFGGWHPTSLQPSEPDRGGSGEQERVSSSEGEGQLS